MPLSHVLSILSALLLAAAEPELLQERQPIARPDILILGAPHFANPGRDINNTSLPDVLQPARQLEIGEIIKRLAAYRPTHIAIEMGSNRQSELDTRYAAYRAGRYKLTHTEADQIGLRLAAQLGLHRVHAVDWNEMPEGKQSDWDYDAYATQHGLADRIARMRAAGRRRADAFTARARCTGIAEWLREANSVEARRATNRTYFDFAMLGSADQNPGATWVGNWYARNLRIFANLVQLADSRDKRILVIYGAGHGFLLDQFARESGAFVVHDPLIYLPSSRRPGGKECLAAARR